MLPRVTWPSTTREIRADSSFVRRCKSWFSNVLKYSESRINSDTVSIEQMIEYLMVEFATKRKGILLNITFRWFDCSFRENFFQFFFVILGRQELLVLFTFNSIRLFNTFNPNCNQIEWIYIISNEITSINKYYSTNRLNFENI